MTTVLKRTTFETSRLLEFFTEKELQMQIGHPRERWPHATFHFKNGPQAGQYLARPMMLPPGAAWALPDGGES